MLAPCSWNIPTMLALLFATRGERMRRGAPSRGFHSSSSASKNERRQSTKTS
uniref:Uncharacterized protein n=1 Tax=uncultured marine virus TaxID=186617 RepID=A0A0F7L655_9VIRU|nr:hypothetical protein [uncultured marine virus]